VEKPKRRWVLGLLSIGLLVFLYRFFTVYTVRSGECKPQPAVAGPFPPRTNFPKQQKPLLVMSYNIAGHDELYDGDHIAEIAAVINQVKPDIVGLEEVHRGTWQSRFRDQLAELTRLTGMHGWFAPAYTQWGGSFGNAVLTRGEFLSNEIHELPSVGEPRIVLESVIRIDGATLDVYTTHLTTWGSLNAKNRGEQLECLTKHVRGSRHPFLLMGDFNAPPAAEEIARFRSSNAAQLTGGDLGATHGLTNKRLDYIFADEGWEVRGARVLAVGPSDHWPITAELLWEREKP